MMNTNLRALAFLGVFAFAAPPAPAADKDARVRVELYVMSLCPFGVQAGNGLLPTAKKYEKQIDLRLGFIVSAEPGAPGQPPKFRALGGEPEVRENIRQLCAKELAPKRYFDYILERNKDYRSQDWRTPAKAVGLDPAALERCADGPQGRDLLINNIPAAQERQATASPTIYIDGASYVGGRTPEAFEWVICEALKAKGSKLPASCEQALAGPKPAALAAGGGPGCGDGADGGGAAAQAPTVFDIQVVQESACKACAPTLLAALKGLHPGAAIKTLDSGSKEGKALIAKHRARTLPLYVLDRKVESESNFMSLLDSQYARSADQYIIKPGPDSYTPSVHLSRERRPRHLDIFVDPFSAFATRAEAELVAFLNESKIKDMTLSVHFLVQEGMSTQPAGEKTATGEAPRSASLSELRRSRPGPLTTARGAVGLTESLRQACLFQTASMGDFFSYLACRNQLLHDAEAPQCLRPDARLQACMTGPEGDRLLRYDARLVRELGVNTSFAILWENRYGPFGWHEVDWKRLLED